MSRRNLRVHSYSTFASRSSKDALGIPSFADEGLYKQGGSVKKQYLIIAGIASAAILLGVLWQLGRGGATGSTEKDLPSVGAQSLRGGPDELLVAAGDQLQLKKIVEQEEIDLGQRPGDVLVPSKGSMWVAYVDPAKDEESFPTLKLFSPGEKGRIEIGPGFSPVWDSTGDRLAYLKPTEESTCEASFCYSAVEAVVRDSGGDELMVTEPGSWNLLGWSGENLIMSDGREVWAVSQENERGWSVPFSRFISVSPDGRWLLSTTKKGPAMAPIEGRELGDKKHLALDDLALASATWSHDSSRLALVVNEGSLPVSDDDRTKPGKQSASLPTGGKVMILEPDDPAASLTLVEQSFSAMPPLLWSLDDQKVVFQRLVDPKVGSLQIQYCPVSSKGSCRIVTTHSGTLNMLRMQ